MAIHVVLVHPEIHWNTGNAGRTCLAVGATLHLIEPLGFSLEEKQVKRAGLDYWEHVDLRVWPGWDDFERALPSILDANITTLIAALFLFQFGTGPVRGFAVTLGIGIITTVFTAFTLTRLIVAYWVRWRRPQRVPI